MNTSLSKRENNRQRWFKRITDWQQSELSQKAYCERHHLGLASFQRWRRLFMQEEVEKDPAPVTFLPINLKETHRAALTIRIDERLCIEVPTGFDPNTLQQVIQVLQAS